MNVLCQYLRHERSERLKALTLDRNGLYDGGVQVLAAGLFERYQLLESRGRRGGGVPLPLERLGLSDTKFTDSGFKYLMQRFEAIYLQNLHGAAHFDRLIDLDLSRNSLQDASIRYLADILRKFQGFNSINLAGLSKMANQSGFVELGRSLKDNHSLQRLDLSKNALAPGTLAELFAAIQDNFVLSELRVDLKHKGGAFVGPSYTLMSMFQVSLAKEAVDL